MPGSLNTDLDFLKGSVPDKQKFVTKKRNQQKKLKRISYNLVVNFMSTAESYFADSLYSFGENSHCIPIIKENT